MTLQTGRDVVSRMLDELITAVQWATQKAAYKISVECYITNWFCVEEIIHNNRI